MKSKIYLAAWAAVLGLFGPGCLSAHGAPPADPKAPAVVWRHPAAARVVAIGDIHGDLDAARRALRLADVIDEKDAWIGGAAVLVQTGDILDRGDDERAILALFEALTAQAAKAGGKVVQINGNHELMNAAGDLRYVTPGGFKDFADVVRPEGAPKLPAEVPDFARGRLAAFLPGGEFALRFARWPVIAVVGDSVFVHGGVHREHVEAGVGLINDDISAWLQGRRPVPARWMGPDGPMWSRVWSGGPLAPADCDRLQFVLDGLKVKRMVVGHTPQPSGITEACAGRVWRIDVGMARHYGGRPAALEITSKGVRALDEAHPSKGGKAPSGGQAPATP